MATLYRRISHAALKSGCCLFGCLPLTVVAAVEEMPKAIRTLLAEHCNTCHSTEKQKGDLDLERFTTMADLKREPMIWEGVLEQIHNGEMPPKKEPQFSAQQKSMLTTWAQARLDEIALANAGDPGPVVLRRLSNMEYTYTLRDLTGVDSLDLAKEFPVDGAAGEGFTNAGAALVMSPALLTKYLDAAKEVARHMVLLPEGIRFSPSTSARDWTDEALAKIRTLYAKHTTSGEGSETVAQGIKLDTGTGSGHLPLAKYLDALQGRATSEGLSTKYLGILREALSSTKPSVLLDSLRAKPGVDFIDDAGDVTRQVPQQRLPQQDSRAPCVTEPGEADACRRCHGPRTCRVEFIALPQARQKGSNSSRVPIVIALGQPTRGTGHFAGEDLLLQFLFLDQGERMILVSGMPAEFEALVRAIAQRPGCIERAAPRLDPEHCADRLEPLPLTRIGFVGHGLLEVLDDASDHLGQQPFERTTEPFERLPEQFDAIPGGVVVCDHRIGLEFTRARSGSWTRSYANDGAPIVNKLPNALSSRPTSGATLRRGGTCPRQCAGFVAPRPHIAPRQGAARRGTEFRQCLALQHLGAFDRARSLLTGWKSGAVPDGRRDWPARLPRGRRHPLRTRAGHVSIDLQETGSPP